MLVLSNEHWVKLINDHLWKLTKWGLSTVEWNHLWCYKTWIPKMMGWDPLLFTRLCLLWNPEFQDCYDAIDADVDRTYISQMYSPSLCKGSKHCSALKNILWAFVNYPHWDGRVEYYQGLNFIAAMLLLHFKSQEGAFYMLHILVYDYHIHKTIKVLDTIDWNVKTMYPHLYSQMDK